MIKVVITIEEESEGVIRFKGFGEDVGGNPTRLEVMYCTDIMKALNEVRSNFTRTKSLIPLTMITTTRKENKEDEHRDSD